MINTLLEIGWTNISINEYLELQSLLLDNEENLDDEDLVLRQIQILTGRNPYTMSITEFKKCVGSLKFLSKPMPKMKLKDSYNLNGNVYYLHKDITEFKMGQYMDYERILQAKKGVDAYPEFLALFLTPSKDDSYGDGYNVQTVVNDVANYMSIADASSMSAFFLRLSKAFIVNSLWYSMHKVTKKMKDRKTKRALRKKTLKLVKLILGGAFPS